MAGPFASRQAATSWSLLRYRRSHRGRVRPPWPPCVRGAAHDSVNGSGQVIPDAYASLVASGDKYLNEQIAKAIPPQQVAAAIVAAAEHRNPRTRYVVPARTRPLIALLSAMPDRLADRAKRQALGQ